MKRGITIWAVEGGTLGEFDLCDAMKQIKAAGFDAVELSFYEKGILSKDYSVNELEYYKQQSKAMELEFSSMSTLLFNDYNLISNSSEERNAAMTIVRKMLEIASVLELKTISFSPGKLTPDITFCNGYERAKDSLYALGDCASTMGIQLCIENVNQKFLTGPFEFRSLLREVKHPNVKACLDIGNTTLNGYPNQWLELIGEHIGKIHLTDTRVRMANMIEFVPIGTGQIEWSQIMPQIVQFHSEFATAEVFYNSKKPEGQLDEIFRNMNQLLGWVQQ